MIALVVVVGVVIVVAIGLSLAEYRSDMNSHLRTIDKIEHDLHMRHLARHNGKRP